MKRKKKETCYMDGILKACGEALSAEKDENIKRIPIIDVTSLWKHCIVPININHENGIYEIVQRTENQQIDMNNLLLDSVKAHAKKSIEEYYEGISVTIKHMPDDTLLAELHGQLKKSELQRYLERQFRKKTKSISIEKLSSFYKREPEWLKDQFKGFMNYIKVLLKLLQNWISSYEIQRGTKELKLTYP